MSSGGQYARAYSKDEDCDPHNDINEFNVPGLDTLRSMRHRTEVVFERECEKLAAYFEAERLAEIEKDCSEARGKVENGEVRLKSVEQARST